MSDNNKRIIINNLDGAKCSGCDEYLREDEVEERCERCDKDLDEEVVITFSYPLYEHRGKKYEIKLIEGIVDDRVYTFTFKSHGLNYKAMPNLTGAQVKAEIQRRIRRYDGFNT